MMTHSISGISRRDFVKGAAVVGFSFTALGQLAGCGTGEQSSSAASHDKIVIVYNDAPTSFDPTTDWDGWYTSCRGLTETLVVFDQNMNLAPCLATEWKNINDTTWQFTIREGVKFQSGADMTPKAVKASIERAIKKSKRAKSKIYLDSITVSGNTVTIKTTKSVATLPGELAEPVFGIVDVAVADKDPSHSGTGPYMGDDVSNVNDFTLKAFSGYWSGAPTVATLACSTITDASSRAMGLQSGDANIAASLNASDLGTFQNDSKYTVLTSQSVRCDYMICNFKNSLLADKVIRQALSFATDRQTLADSLLSGSISANGLPFPSYLSYSEATKDVAQTYDLDKARKLLNDAGYVDTDNDGVREKNGHKLSFELAYYASRPELPQLAPALQDAYNQIGIKVTPKLYENVSTAFYSGDFDLMLYNTTTIGNGDPSYYLKLYFATKGSENAGAYSNQEVDKIVARMQSTFDKAKRFELAQEAIRKIMADCPNIFLGTPVMNAVEGPDVSGYELYPVEYYGVTHNMK